MNIYRVTMISRNGNFVAHPVGNRNNIYVCNTDDEAKMNATDDYRAGRTILPDMQYIVEFLGEFEPAKERES